jgi:hypothetical protein
MAGVRTPFAAGNYHSLAASGRPFSEGVVADPGFDLVHAVFVRPLALHDGIEAARRHVEAAGRPATALAAFELRIPAPLSREAFDAFNAPYRERMAALGLTAGGEVVTARTNVAPAGGGVSEPALYAFTYTVPGRVGPRPAFRLSGATETRRDGSTADKLRSIMDKLTERLMELGVRWDDSTAISLYGPTAETCGLDAGVLAGLGAAGLHGLTWFPSRPPLQGLQFEIDARGVGAELLL